MRKIKFRAIFVSLGKWVYGNFIHSKRFQGCSNEFRIHDQETGLESDVCPKTIGQFTGLHDKNGREIYEGDVLKRIVKASKLLPAKFFFEVVRFENASFKTFDLKKENDMGDVLADYSFHKIEIIGNIHENPELLKL